MTLQAQLASYCTAFNGRNLDAVLSLFAEQALFEMPLLGQRLIGKGEIAAGFRRIFEVSQSATITLSATRESNQVAIAEGNMVAKLHRDEAPVELPLAMALEGRDGEIARLSTYLDARPYRLWADGPIFAATNSAANQ